MNAHLHIYECVKECVSCCAQEEGWVLPKLLPLETVN